MHLSRRAVLIAGGAGVAAAGTVGALVEQDVLPGRTRVHRMLGLTGEVGVIPGVAPGEQYDAVMALVREELEGGRVRIDCGTADPFYRDVLTVVPDEVEQHYTQGDHDAAYWTRVLPGELDWLAARM